LIRKKREKEGKEKKRKKKKKKEKKRKEKKRKERKGSSRFAYKMDFASTSPSQLLKPIRFVPKEAGREHNMSNSPELALAALHTL